MQYLTGEKPVVDDDMGDVDKAGVSAVKTHIRFDTNVVKKRKCYFQGFFYTFYNLIILQMMSLRLTQTHIHTSTTNRVCTVYTHLMSLRYLFNVIVSELEHFNRVPGSSGCMPGKLEVDKVYTPSPPHLDDLPRSSPVPSWADGTPLSPVEEPSGEESLSFTPVVAVEGDGLLVNVENRKCYSQEFFYTFHNLINLQMMSLRLTKALTRTSTTNRVCTNGNSRRMRRRSSDVSVNEIRGVVFCFINIHIFQKHRAHCCWTAMTGRHGTRPSTAVSIFVRLT